MIDVLLDNDNDLIIENGDFAVGFSDYQHQALLLLMQKGELKESPLATVGIINYLRDSDIGGMLSEIRTRFVNDGMSMSQLSYDEQTGNLNYVANYSD